MENELKSFLDKHFGVSDAKYSIMKDNGKTLWIGCDFEDGEKLLVIVNSRKGDNGNYRIVGESWKKHGVEDESMADRRMSFRRIVGKRVRMKGSAFCEGEIGLVIFYGGSEFSIKMESDRFKNKWNPEGVIVSDREGFEILWGSEWWNQMKSNDFRWIRAMKKENGWNRADDGNA